MFGISNKKHFYSAECEVLSCPAYALQFIRKTMKKKFKDGRPERAFHGNTIKSFHCLQRKSIISY